MAISTYGQQRLLKLGQDVSTQFGTQLLLQEGKALMDNLITVRPTPSIYITDSILGRVPVVKLLQDTREFNNLQVLDSAAGLDSRVKQCLPYGNSVKVKKTDVMSRNVVLDAGAIASGLAARVAEHPSHQATVALLNSTTTHNQYIGFDSQAIFSTAHTYPGNPSVAAQSNLMSGTFTEANVEEYIATARAWQDNEGQPLFSGGDLKPVVMVGEKNYWTAAKMFDRNYGTDIVGGTATAENILKNKIEWFSNPWLDAYGEADSFYIFFRRAGISPIVHAVFEQPLMINIVDPQNLHVAMTREFLFMTEMYTHTFVPFWYNCLKSTGTGTASSTYTGNTILVTK